MKSLEQRIRAVAREQIELVPYDPNWVKLYLQEKLHLQASIPANMVGRIEHFGSTAIPGLKAKPIIDILVEVRSLEETRKHIVPILLEQGYEYFWRPTVGDDTPPFYAWFIKRDSRGQRSHHIHMVEKEFEHWDGLLFRDYLIQSLETAQAYEALKFALQEMHENDRAAYTQGKTEFIKRVIELAKQVEDCQKPE